MEAAALWLDRDQSAALSLVSVPAFLEQMLHRAVPDTRCWDQASSMNLTAVAGFCFKNSLTLTLVITVFSQLRI